MKAYICDGCGETKQGEARYTIIDRWLELGNPIDGWDACSWACVEEIAKSEKHRRTA